MGDTPRGTTMNNPPAGGAPPSQPKLAKPAKKEEVNPLGMLVVGVAIAVGLYHCLTAEPKPKYNIPPAIQARYNAAQSANPAPQPVWVSGHYRQDGVYVNGHYRTAPDNTTSNNWSSYPNVNPYTGQRGSR
jgi:hypothetical protein